VSAGVVVLVNGPSAAGKSWLVAAVSREARRLDLDVRCATRATTRARRERETLPGENRYLEPAEFAFEARTGALDVHWRRPLSAGRELRYGFALADQLEHGVVVLSANNYLDWAADPLLARLRADGRLLVVRVWAPLPVREARLRNRRPAFDPVELRSRLRDVPEAALPAADHVILNAPPFEAEAEAQLLRLATAFGPVPEVAS